MDNNFLSVPSNFITNLGPTTIILLSNGYVLAYEHLVLILICNICCNVNWHIHNICTHPPTGCESSKTNHYSILCISTDASESLYEFNKDNCCQLQ